MITLVLKKGNFVLKTRGFVLKTRNFVLKLMDSTADSDATGLVDIEVRLSLVDPSGNRKFYLLHENQ